MNLPNDIARCDGLLPKTVIMPSGAVGKAWIYDCPKRETCARFCQTQRDDPYARTSYGEHHHAPAETCLDFIQEA